MKTTKLLVGTAVLAFALTGCILTSVHPFYTEKDLMFDAALLGKWSKPSDKESWQFDRAGENAYRLTLVADGKTNVLQAHLFKLQDTKYLDLFSPDVDSEQVVPPIPAHMFVRILEISKMLKYAAPNHDAVRQLLEKDPKLTPHLVYNEDGKPENRRIVLTGTTAQLQKFLTRNLRSLEMWGDVTELERQ